MYRQQIDQVEFEHYHSNMWQYPTFLGVCSNLLSTDARCLVIKLGVQCDMVDFALNSVVRSIGVSRYTCQQCFKCFSYERQLLMAHLVFKQSAHNFRMTTSCSNTQSKSVTNHTIALI